MEKKKMWKGREIWCYSSHGVVHPAARRPANKVTFAIISSPSPKATKNGLDTVTGAPKGCEQ